MQKVFFRNLAFLITVNFIIKPVWIFGIDRTVQNVVGAESYGLYFVLTSLSFLTQILLDLGISNYNNRLIAQREDLLTNHLSHILTIKLWLSLLYIIITFILAFVLGYGGNSLHLLLFICLNQALASLIVYIRTNISALHHFKVDSMFSVIDKALMILMCGSLLYLPILKSGFTIEWFIYSQTIAYIITLLIALGYVLSISGKIPLNFSFPFTKKLLHDAFPFAALIALMFIYARVDGVMIEYLLPSDGQREAGLYASAFRLLDALNQFGYLFSVLLLPIFSRMLAKKQPIDELVKASFTVIYIVALIASVSLFYYSKPIMSLLYHEGNAYTASILSNLVFGFVGYCTVFIFGTLLTANGNLKELIIVSAFAVVLNISTNLWLIPLNKASGAALAASTTQIAIAVLNFIAALYIFKWKINYTLIARLISFTLITFFLFYMSGNINFSWVMKIIITSFACVIIAFMIRLLQVKKVLQLLREN